MRKATMLGITRFTRPGTRLRGSGTDFRIGSNATFLVSGISRNFAQPWRRGGMSGHYTPDEMMTIAAARMLRNGAVCFVGIGLPSAAGNVARLTHAPDVVLIYESGPIGARPSVLPLSIGDGELSETPAAVVSIPEMFAYWLQGGRIDVVFLGAAQIDRFANINTTVIGDYRIPKTRLPGAGGAPEIA